MRLFAEYTMMKELHIQPSEMDAMSEERRQYYIAFINAEREEIAEQNKKNSMKAR